MGWHSSTERYVRSGHKRVQGWLEDDAILLLTAIATIQDDHGITGSTGEIGVHHGKLFLLLHLLSDGCHNSVAWDVWESQGFNNDELGRGARAAFENNVRRYAAFPERIEAVVVNSADLSAADMARSLGSAARLLSVDGGHTADLTEHDIRIAIPNLAPGGVLAVDDYFNPMEPGVSEGVARVCTGADPPIPIAIGGNKITFSSSEAWASTYREALPLVVGRRWHRATFFGHDVLILGQ